MKKILQITIITAFLFSTFISCDKTRVYELNTPINNERWHKDSIYSFIFNVDDTLTTHNILVNIRNTGNYRYRNLLIYVNLYMPDNHTIIDTLNCILADKKGKWYGKGWGSIWSSTIPYKTNIRFPEKGKYSISLNHAMRDETLKAITDIGIRIEKTN